MGRLIDGVWHDQWYDTKATGGRFERSESQFRDRITADGASGFKAEAGRYHLYVALSCPWAHRTVIMRALKGLEDAIGLSVVDTLMMEEGWVFSEAPGCIPDTANGFSRLHEVYTKADPGYTGRVTVPALWDKERQTIVNNESSVNRTRVPWTQVCLTAAGLTSGRSRRRHDLTSRLTRGSGSRSFRHRPGGLRGGLRRPVRHPRRVGGASRWATLPGRSAHHRCRLAGLHHPGAL